METLRHLKDFSDMFFLASLVNTATCSSSARRTATDIMLTNRPHSFRYICAVTTGWSDCHKLILSGVRAHLKRLPPTNYLKNNENFSTESFLFNLNHEMLRDSFYQSKEQ